MALALDAIVIHTRRPLASSSAPTQQQRGVCLPNRSVAVAVVRIPESISKGVKRIVPLLAYGDLRGELERAIAAVR